ncbi:MAG: hypothetical protein CMJ46_07330 [Planctomyces sp.]|nr:hypothetical protein [Planctomyces sp.]
MVKTSWTAETGADGQFLILSVPLSERYDLHVSDGLFEEAIDSVSLRSWNPIATVNKQFGTAVDITVTILDANEQPVEGLELAIVQLQNGRENYWVQEGTRTD